MKKIGCFGFVLVIIFVVLSFMYWDTAKSFYWGLFHGLVAPFTLFLQLLINKVNFYNNSFTGLSEWLFDFGFFIGITSSGVSGPVVVKRKRR